jgi:hypothetical protein
LVKIAKAAVAAASGPKKMITLHRFDNVEACEIAQHKIIEAVENKLQKGKAEEVAIQKEKGNKKSSPPFQRLRGGGAS